LANNNTKTLGLLETLNCHIQLLFVAVYVFIIADQAQMVNRFLVFLPDFLAQKSCIFATKSSTWVLPA
jgi:mannose/fructose/N-acetylgalactosamine-specific phosphotransferase system component IIC